MIYGTMIVAVLVLGLPGAAAQAQPKNHIGEPLAQVMIEAGCTLTEQEAALGEVVREIALLEREDILLSAIQDEQAPEQKAFQLERLRATEEAAAETDRENSETAEARARSSSRTRASIPGGPTMRKGCLRSSSYRAASRIVGIPP